MCAVVCSKELEWAKHPLTRVAVDRIGESVADLVEHHHRETVEALLGSHREFQGAGPYFVAGAILAGGNALGHVLGEREVLLRTLSPIKTLGSALVL